MKDRPLGINRNRESHDQLERSRRPERRRRWKGSILGACLRRRTCEGRTHAKCGKDGENELHQVAAPAW